MDEYARQHGHEPTDSWILIVHPDGESNFLPFDDPSEMWCCDLAPLIRYIIDKEGKDLGKA